MSGKDTTFRDAVSLSFEGAHVSQMSIFHKVFHSCHGAT